MLKFNKLFLTLIIFLSFYSLNIKGMTLDDFNLLNELGKKQSQKYYPVSHSSTSIVDPTLKERNQQKPVTQKTSWSWRKRLLIGTGITAGAIALTAYTVGAYRTGSLNIWTALKDSGSRFLNLFRKKQTQHTSYNLGCDQTKISAFYGLDDNTRSKIEDQVCILKQNDQTLQNLGIKQPSGIILYGPPGTGKTFLAEKLIAEQAGRNLITVTPQDILSGQITITNVIEQAKSNSINGKAAIVFWDEVDAIFVDRDKLAPGDQRISLINEFLTLASANSKITHIFATNDIRRLDKAVTRSGRFDNAFYLGLPFREDLFKFLSDTFSKLKGPLSQCTPIKKLKQLASKMANKGFTINDALATINNAKIKIATTNQKCLSSSVLEDSFENIAAKKSLLGF